jgi:hypothetical protein
VDVGVSCGAVGGGSGLYIVSIFSNHTWKGKGRESKHTSLETAAETGDLVQTRGTAGFYFGFATLLAQASLL